MPMLGYLLRVLRKKTLASLFVGLILFLVLGNILYFGSSFLTSEDSYVLHLRKLNQPFNWNLEESDLDTGNFSDSNLFTCRNSVQGKTVIADDKGFVCPRTELLGNGCCNGNSSLTEKHVCDECDEVRQKGQVVVKHLQKKTIPGDQLLPPLRVLYQLLSPARPEDQPPGDPQPGRPD